MTLDEHGRDDRPLRGTWIAIAGETEQAISNLNDRVRESWTAPPDIRVHAACDLGELAARFVNSYLRLSTEPDSPPSGVPAVRQNEDFALALKDLGPVVRGVDGCLFAISQRGHQSVLIDKLASLSKDLLAALERAVAVLIVVVRDNESNEYPEDERSRTLQRADEVRNALYARRLIDEAEDALDETRKARDAAKDVVGEIGADSLGVFYSDYAKREARSADLLRWVTGGLLCLITASALLMNIPYDEVSVKAELVRLSATIPIAVLAGYLARESTKHRRSATWGRELAIALHTLPTYVRPAHSSRAELWRVVGLRAFMSRERSIGSAESGLYDDFLATLEKAQEIVGRVKGNREEPPSSAQPTGQGK